MRALTQAQRGLMDQLGELVENEVIKPMNTVQWDAGNQQFAELNGLPGMPAAAPQDGQAPAANGQPVAQPPTAPPAPDNAPTTDLFTMLESLRRENGLILGKYKDVPAAVQGVQHAVGMAHEAFDQRDAALRQLDELRSTLPPAVSPVAPVVHDTTQLDAALARILEDGGMITPETVVDLREAIVKTAVTAAPQPYVDPDQPLWDAAFAQMEKEAPTFKESLDDIGLFLRANPILKEGVDALVAQKKFFAASKLAYDSMSRVAPTALSPAERKAIELTAQGSVRQEAVDAARKDAGVITTTAGGGHELPSAGPSQAEIDAAAAHYATTADGRAWRQLAFANELNSPLFD